jgi:hypothetical protein
MARVVAERNPGGTELPYYSRRARSTPAIRWWYRWQDFFDRLVHEMSLSTGLGARQVVARAAELADLAIAEEKKREKRGRH